MAADPAVLDITRIPEVLRIAERVRASGEPVVLRAGDEDIAVLTPVARKVRHGRRPRTAAEQEIALSAFGGWKGNIDGEHLKEQIREARGSDRPVVDL
jgi:hypothetical protein